MKFNYNSLLDARNTAWSIFILKFLFMITPKPVKAILINRIEILEIEKGDLIKHLNKARSEADLLHNRLTWITAVCMNEIEMTPLSVNRFASLIINLCDPDKNFK